MGVDTDAVGTDGDNDSVHNGPTHWDQFCDDFADIFETPGFPAKCDIEHDIKLPQVLLYNSVVYIAFMLQS